jgi:hypothetical protein
VGVLGEHWESVGRRERFSHNSVGGWIEDGRRMDEVWAKDGYRVDRGKSGGCHAALATTGGGGIRY